MLMVGPPAAGKSMLAARLPTILPPLTPAELLEVSMIASRVRSRAALIDRIDLHIEVPAVTANVGHLGSANRQPRWSPYAFSPMPGYRAALFSDCSC